MRTSLALVSLVPLLAACQSSLGTADAGSTTPTDVVTVADTPVVTDGGAPADTGPAGDSGLVEMRSYTPMGCAHTVTATTGSHDNYFGDRTTFGAMPTPANVHVSWPADPSTVAAFVWQTDDATYASVVQYGTDMAALSQTAVGSVSTGGSGANGVTIHETHVCGLTPDTTYYYRVGGEGHWSAVQHFKTAPAAGRTDYNVNFVVAGDSRDNFTVWQQVQQRIMSGTQPPDFQLFSGDAVLLGTQQGAWQTWFTNAQPSLAAAPFVMVHGNHDALAINYLMQFAQPQSASASQSELYFSFDYGPVHFLVLNDTPPNADYAGEVAGTELNWIRTDLMHAQANRAHVPFIIAVHHKPAFASSQHSAEADTVAVRNAWPPVFDQYGVDVVFSGHEHDFEVSNEVDGTGASVSGRRGTRYYVAAGAGAQLYTLNGGTARPWSAYFESVVNFLRVHATMTSLEITPYRMDGTVINQGHLTFTPRS